VYSTLFGTGYLLLGWTVWGLACVTVAALAAAFLWRDLQREEVTLFGAVEAQDN
jgi:type VI protein secretion system component VasF